MGLVLKRMGRNCAKIVRKNCAKLSAEEVPRCKIRGSVKSASKF